MSLYSGTVTEFSEDSAHNRIADRLRVAFRDCYRYEPGPSEVASWRNSLRAMAQVFDRAQLKDNGVLLEYKLPATSRRLDCMVTGRSGNRSAQAMIVELKQWEECEPTEGELILTRTGGAKRDVLHPSVQVGGYRNYLADAHTAFHLDPDAVGLGACSYLHNYAFQESDEGMTKDKDKRAVPLRLELADELRRARPEDVSPTRRVFWFAWPTYDILRGDFKRAKIERKDGLGRVVHFHSFRKTWQTLGVRYGINQRAAQEVLGHSDAILTAKAYTDVPALALHTEIAKLPWIAEPEDGPRGCAQIDAQKLGISGPVASLADMLRQLQVLSEATGTEGISHFSAPGGVSGQILKMAARAGTELATKLINGSLINSSAATTNNDDWGQRTL